MANSERLASNSQLLKAVALEQSKSIYTCIPGHVIAFDPVKQRAQIQIGIARIDVNGILFEPSPIVDVPVCFPGDQYTVEYAINPGCEGLIHFSQRCVDGWKNTGGIADNPQTRFHHRQDAFFSPGGRSLGNVISGFANDGFRIRNKTGTQYAWLKGDGTVAAGNANGSITINPDGSQSMVNASGSIMLLANGNVNINGVIITPAGRITAPASGGITGSNGINFETHKHTGVQTGSGTSGGPTN